jgi:hypothetical protein
VLRITDGSSVNCGRKEELLMDDLSNVIVPLRRCGSGIASIEGADGLGFGCCRLFSEEVSALAAHWPL